MKTEQKWKDMKAQQKWEKLQNYLIEGLEGAEAGEKHETEKAIRVTLEKMDELDKNAV